jgi:hypothetical protein
MYRLKLKMARAIPRGRKCGGNLFEHGLVHYSGSRSDVESRGRL